MKRKTLAPKSIVLFIFFTVFSGFVYSQPFAFSYATDYERIKAESKDTSSDICYEKLLSRFNRIDSSLTDYEMLALLIGFTGREAFRPYNYVFSERDVSMLNHERKYEEAIALSDSLLNLIPVSQQVLLEKSYALYKLGQSDSSEQYTWKFRRIMEAMARSGTGVEADQAFFAMGPADGQNFIRHYLQGHVGKTGSGRDSNGNFVDILEMTWMDTGSGKEKSRILYFQIEHASQTMLEDVDIDKIREESKKK